ncbi:MAG: hypothetical protein JEZ11_19390 [Desulfobacterales bacterium]|nr:hypothetical protein [Desulfobacterales bacterium]
MEKIICPANPTADAHGDYLRRRSRSLGTTMVVMGASFALYYLGFFGGVTGPLEPERLGAILAGMGMTQRHVLVILLSILIMAATWNWLYNLVGLMTGTRLRCSGPGTGGQGLCGGVVRRERSVIKRSGRTVTVYVCPHGHRRPEAHFQPVRKGTVSHCLWVTALVFCLVTFFLG